MFKRNYLSTLLASFAATGFIAAGPANADSLSQVTNPSAQQATDSINWASIGGDQTLLNAGGSVPTTKGSTVQIALAGPNAVLSKVCSASPCSWTGTGLKAGDTLLWTSDAGNGGTGPVRITLPTGMAGGGAYVQADGPGIFTAKVEAFNGSTSLGSFSSTSNAQGAPVYMGILDQTGPNVTSLVFSLTSVSNGLTSDFGLDAVNLTASAAAPVISLTPTSISFGNVLVGTTSSSQSITLKNTGTAPLTISGIAASIDFKQTNNCTSPLAAGASCVISAAYHPSAAGSRTGTISVSGNAKNSPASASTSGTGIAPIVRFTRTSLVFPAQLLQSQSVALPVTMGNGGTAPLTFTSIVASGDFKQSNNCVSPLAVGARCTINVVLTPTAIGNRSGAISVTDNAASSPQQVSLSGVGTEVKLSASRLTFPATTVGQSSAAQSLTLSNVGTTALSITSIAVTGASAADYRETTTCGTSVAAGASCTVSVVFAPKGTGARTASLTITDNGGASPQQVALSGTGQ